MATFQIQAGSKTSSHVSRLATARIRAWSPSLVFGAAFVLFLSRRPDAILNAQFFAEDGKIWYAHAYQYGLRCLLIPDGGYLHTVSRLIALVSLLVPLAYAPLLMNLCAMALQILPINFFLSSRFSAIDVRLRFCCAALYVGLPNSAEIDANITTLQWHLALLAVLVLLSKPVESKVWMVVDFTVLVLLSLDGPNGILLIPLAAILWWKRRDPQSLVRLVAIVPGAMVQLAVMNSAARAMAGNGATLERLIRILARRVFLSALVGGDNHGIHHMRRYLVGSAIVVILGIGAVVHALLRAQLELKLFVLFGAAVLAAALKAPLIGEYPQWELAFQIAAGCRYWFFPMLSFLAALIWIVTEAKNPNWLRAATLMVLLLMPIGIYKDWRYQPFVDLTFEKYVEEFKTATPGTVVRIPVNPPGWQMELVKR